jgi:hypothetical protein
VSALQPNRLPARIRLENTTGYPIDTSVVDAETGEVVQGVLEIEFEGVIERGEQTLTIWYTRNWPIQNDDIALHVEDYGGRRYKKGLLLDHATFTISKMNIEVW